MNFSQSTNVILKKILILVYLSIVVYFTIDYWFVSDKPIFNPLIARLSSIIYNINELPLGETWTKRYTLRVTPYNGAGLIEGNCVIFLPFSVQNKATNFEIEVRSLCICPGYETEIKVFFNDSLVCHQTVGYDWQVVSFIRPTQKFFIPAYLKLHFGMRKIDIVPKYDKEKIIRIYPEMENIQILNEGKWMSVDYSTLIRDSVIVDNAEKILYVYKQKLRFEGWPVIVVLTDWYSQTRLNYLFNAPIVACRSVCIR